MTQDLPSYIPSDGLVAYYPFNGNANDESGNGHHATVNGAILSSDRDGNNEKAYEFSHEGASFGDNLQSIYIPFHSDFQSENFTVSIWFKADSYGWNGNSKIESTLFSKRENSSQPNQATYRIQLSSNFTRSEIGGPDGDDEIPCKAVSAELNLGAWYHAASSYDGTTLKQYINGVKVSEINCDLSHNAISTSGIMLGQTWQYNGYWYHLDGKLDEFMVYNRPMTEQEMENYYVSATSDILFNGTVSAENNQIKNVSDPTDAQDAATKSYVDSKTTEISNSQNFSNNSKIGLTGIVYDFEGNRYNTVVMCDGKQWTTQYLNVSFFANGDPIPEVVGNDAWRDLTTPAWCYPFNEDSGIGKLYNGFALTDARGLAPEGWHIATEDDWNNLIECLGGADVAGGKIKLSGTEYWAAPNVGSSPSGKASNSSGMSLTPAVSREGANGNFYSQNSVGFWNYSTIDGRRPYVELIGDQARINQGLTDPYDGSYILLVKD